MKVAFFASDKIAIESIRKIMLSPICELACVVSNPDKEKGRGKKLSPNDVSAFALENSIKLFRPLKNEEDLLCSDFDELGVDAIIVMAYGSILRDKILNYAKYCLNLHGSLLPELRGASPIESAIASGMPQTGVCLMQVGKKMDAGAVAGIAKIDILESDTASILREKIGILAAELLEVNVEKISKGELVFVPQEHEKATYARKLNKFDMRLDFNKSAKEIFNRIRAFGAGIFSYGGVDIKVYESSYEFCQHNKKFGEIMCENTSLKIACKESYLNVLNLQKPCARAMNIADFLKGFSFKSGDVLESATNKDIIEIR